MQNMHEHQTHFQLQNTDDNFSSSATVDRSVSALRLHYENNKVVGRHLQSLAKDQNVLASCSHC